MMAPLKVRIAVLLSAAFLSALVIYFVPLLLSPLDLNSAVIDHPALSTQLSQGSKALFTSYTLTLLFLIALVAIIVAAVAKGILNLILKRYAFIIWLLALLGCAFIAYTRFFSTVSLPGWLIAFALWLVVTGYLVGQWSRAGMSRTRNFLYAVVSFIALGVLALIRTSLDDRMGPALGSGPVLRLGILFFFAVSILSCYHFVGAAVARGRSAGRAHRSAGPALTIIVVVLVVQTALSAAGYYWEKSEISREYRDTMLAPAESTIREGTNVILILIDALRAENVGCYGYERPVSPVLDAFSKEAVKFECCYTHASWTKPSCSSMLTSLYPCMHGTNVHGAVLPEEVTTISEIFKQQGYVTYCYMANPNLKAIFGFNQGFDFFDDLMIRDRMYYAAVRNLPVFNHLLLSLSGRTFIWIDNDNAKVANGRIFPWLEQNKDATFFMYLHYMDPHNPYAPPPPYDTLFEHEEGNVASTCIALYDGEIRFVDEHIGHLFEKLKALGLYDNTLIVLTSDHGEEFGEHGTWFHGKSIYQQALRVPLIIRFPDETLNRRVVSTPVRNVDIMPTILHAVKVPYEGALEGVSLLPLLLDGRQRPAKRDVYVDENLDTRFIFKGLVKDARWKYILTEKSEERDTDKYGYEELYDLENDPGETTNLIEAYPDTLTKLRDLVSEHRQYCKTRAIVAPERALDQETIEQLKALGYLQ
jgi:arylsulfatase A-like enzyme